MTSANFSHSTVGHHHQRAASSQKQEFPARHYVPLFGRGHGRVVASAIVFAFGHIVFHNWPAVGLTLIGGWLFARTYQRTASLWLVAVEHALYGCAIFTLGYGQFFLDGTLRLLQSGGHA